MTNLQLDGLALELTTLIGKKELSFDSLFNQTPATLTDFHKWLNEKFRYGFEQISDNETSCILIKLMRDTVKMDGSDRIVIPYNSSKSLLEQDESTLEQIRDLIINNQ